MSDYTLTENLGLYKPNYALDVGQWGNHLNLNADKLDAALGGGALILKSLPTSPVGLVSGQVWLNGIILCVVP